MEIGILSMQRVINYGSFLQGYSLKKYLESRGHNVSFIDIKPGRQIVENTEKKDDSNPIKYVLNRLDSELPRKIKRYSFTKERTRRFNEEFFPVLQLGEVNYSSDYDAVVIGSDEVFNCTQASSWGFSKSLLGEGLDSDITLSYAASCGSTTIDKVAELGLREEVKGAMDNFKVISVRDNNTRKFAEEFTNKDVYTHLDPTFLYDFSKEFEDIQIEEDNYILLYGYDDRIREKSVKKEIKKFAKENNLKILSCGVFQGWADKNILCTPFELLMYFKNASYILTDTFHGTIFSIRSGKPFATIIRDSNKEKLRDLLGKFDLLDREVKGNEDISEVFMTGVDSKNVNKTILEYRDKADRYFSKYLGDNNDHTI